MCKYNIGYRVVHKNHGPQTFKAHRTLQSYGIYTWFTNKKTCLGHPPCLQVGLHSEAPGLWIEPDSGRVSSPELQGKR